MSIQVECPGCGRAGNAPDGAIGRAVKCPACGSKILIKDPSAQTAGDFTIENPAVSPQGKASTQAIDSSVRAQAKLRGPAIALIVTAVVGIGLSLVMMSQSLFFMRALPQINQDVGNFVGQQPRIKPEDAKQVREALGLFSSISSLWQTMSVTLALVSTIGGVIVLAAALSMMSLRRYPLAISGAAIAMIPLISPCCLMGLPFGIWAMIVLCQPDVRSTFSPLSGREVR